MEQKQGHSFVGSLPNPTLRISSQLGGVIYGVRISPFATPYHTFGAPGASHTPYVTGARCSEIGVPAASLRVGRKEVFEWGDDCPFGKGRCVGAALPVVACKTILKSYHEVTKDHVGELTINLSDATTAEAQQKALEDCTARQTAWVLRGQGGKQPEYKVPKRHRVAARNLLEYIDHQLRCGGVPRGLTHFRITDTATHWSEWPVLTWASDQESSNLSAVHWAMHKGQLCIDAVYDPGHGAWNDVKACARGAGLYAELLSFLFVANIQHGPWGSTGFVIALTAAISDNTKMFEDIY